MKHILLLLILACLCSLQSWSQKNGALHLSVGGALPIGKFASKDVNDTASGLAKLGGIAELGYSYPAGGERWGLTIGLRGRLNSIDNQANMAPLKDAYPEFQWSASNSHYKVLSAMAGAYYIFPVAAKVDLRAELSVGAAKCYLPELNVKGILDTAHTGATDLIQARSNKNNKTTFSATAKFGMVYHLSKRLQLLANLDYWYLDPTFRNVTQTVLYARGFNIPGNLSPNNATSLSVYTTTLPRYKQNMSTLNLSVGLAFAF